jgi:hypothetical protein
MQATEPAWAWACLPASQPGPQSPHLTIAQRLWMGSMILEDWLQARAKRVVEE